MVMKSECICAIVCGVEKKAKGCKTARSVNGLIRKPITFCDLKKNIVNSVVAINLRNERYYLAMFLEMRLHLARK